LILLTRRDFPLLTSTLRGRGQINEIGVADLYFSVDETAFFLKHALGRSIDAKHLETIQEALEGWPAGIRLMVQSLNYSGDLDFLLAGLDGGFATIVDYLWNEVLLHQSPEMAKLMSATAILECFCAPLCDVLIEADPVLGAAGINGDEFIAKLQKGNLFLISLDTANHWFRYHHIFQQLLKNQLHKWWRPEEITTLHSQINSWCAGNNITLAGIEELSDTLHVPADGSQSQTIAPLTASLPKPRLSSVVQPAMVDPLTNRELDVLELLAQRFSNKEIAEKLCISTTTVKGHLQSIYGKLNVSKRRDATDRAKKMGII
jgi:LuxR family maltose regulon positive regulatory protein